MSLHGREETKLLKKNLEDQLERLVQQLDDLDRCREELDIEEYEEAKNDTIDQMKEFDERLQRMLSGDMTLIDDLGAIQLAIQSAITESFKTPAVIKMFCNREPKRLRERLALIQRDRKLGIIDKESCDSQLREIFTALRHLGENLNAQEMKLLDMTSHSITDSSNFVQISDYVESGGHEALEIASEEVRVNCDS